MERSHTDSATSVQVSPDCISKFNELKLGKTIKYIIYKLSDDNREIVVEDASESGDWDEFREKLVNAKSKTKSGAVTKGPRYAVYDFNYDLASGEGQRSKITFIAWSPDDAGIQVRLAIPCLFLSSQLFAASSGFTSYRSRT
jgi:hypothetical protein